MTFDEFLDTQLGPLTRYARVLSGDRQSAHDLVADTLVAASKRWDKIGQLDLPAAYVRRMLTFDRVPGYAERATVGQRLP